MARFIFPRDVRAVRIQPTQCSQCIHWELTCEVVLTKNFRSTGRFPLRRLPFKYRDFGICRRKGEFAFPVRRRATCKPCRHCVTKLG